ncbi:MAG: restriction endonuclease [Planctomycetota bacterium]
MSPLSFKDAGREVLLEAGEPLHYREMARRALSRGLVMTDGKTPEATLNAQISVDISRQGDSSKFIRTAPGVFGLREWIGSNGLESYDADSERRMRIRVAHYPTYSETVALLPILDGRPVTELMTMRSEVAQQRGTPQEQANWSDPDSWIDERLEGRSADLARRIWTESQRVVNPRYVDSDWSLASKYELLESDASGVLQLTAKGRSFIEDQAGPTVQEIDVHEGLDRILRFVAELGPIGQAKLFPPFAEFAREVSTLNADATIKSFLYTRLRNLVRRGLIERAGRSYSATDAGLDWLASIGDGDATEEKQEQDLLQLARARSREVRDEIADRLSVMDPFGFEHLVKAILEAMDYEDVEVTSKSGDGGVDVLARIQLGITEVVEVVQVKRHAKNIQRKDLDALRGSLHRFSAVRGTIITTGGFARGTKEAAFEPGAAPITLIDGQRLIDLMLDHEIGVTKRRIELLEIEPSAFTLIGDDDD